MSLDRLHSSEKPKASLKSEKPRLGIELTPSLRVVVGQEDDFIAVAQRLYNQLGYDEGTSDLKAYELQSRFARKMRLNDDVVTVVPGDSLTLKPDGVVLTHSSTERGFSVHIDSEVRNRISELPIQEVSAVFSSRQGFHQVAYRLYKENGVSRSKEAALRLMYAFIEETGDPQLKVRPGDRLIIGPYSASLIRDEGGIDKIYTVSFDEQGQLYSKSRKVTQRDTKERLTAMKYTIAPQENSDSWKGIDVKTFESFLNDFPQLQGILSPSFVRSKVPMLMTSEPDKDALKAYRGYQFKAVHFAGPKGYDEEIVLGINRHGKVLMVNGVGGGILFEGTPPSMKDLKLSLASALKRYLLSEGSRDA